jgi:hypothetical protein
MKQKNKCRRIVLHAIIYSCLAMKCMPGHEVHVWIKPAGFSCSSSCSMLNHLLCQVCIQVKCGVGGGGYTCYKLHLRWVLVSKKSFSPNKEYVLTSSVAAGDLVDVPTGLKVQKATLPTTLHLNPLHCRSRICPQCSFDLITAC